VIRQFHSKNLSFIFLRIDKRQARAREGRVDADSKAINFTDFTDRVSDPHAEMPTSAAW
jgi:hypothetical protein